MYDLRAHIIHPESATLITKIESTGVQLETYIEWSIALNKNWMKVVICSFVMWQVINLSLVGAGIIVCTVCLGGHHSIWGGGVVVFEINTFERTQFLCKHVIKFDIFSAPLSRVEINNSPVTKTPAPLPQILSGGSLTSKHEASTQCCFNVGPPSVTLAQH